MMWYRDDVDSVHVERIGRNGKQLLKNIRYISRLLEQGNGV